MDQNDNSLLIHGIVNAILPFPNMIFTSFWSLILISTFFSFDVPNDSPLIFIVLLSPLLISPVSSVIGIVNGIRFLKKRQYAAVCLILSVIGIVSYAGLMLILEHIGSEA